MDKKNLLNSIDDDSKLKDLHEHYEGAHLVYQALKRVKYLIYCAQEQPPSCSVSLRDHLKNEDFTLIDGIDAVIDLNALLGVGCISLGDDLKEYCYSKA
tara:strand:- start:6858 stop:7154 length:297 start_codon:yes stop_codon:yes gene_type:complete